MNSRSPKLSGDYTISLASTLLKNTWENKIKIVLFLPIRNHRDLKLQKEKNPFLVPDSKLHSLPKEVKRWPCPCLTSWSSWLRALCLGALGRSGLPRSATAQYSRHQNGLTRLEGKGSCSYSHSLLFVFNGKRQLHHCIPQVPGRRGAGCSGTAGWQAVQVPPQLWLRRGSANAAMGSGCLGGMGRQPSLVLLQDSLAWYLII